MSLSLSLFSSLRFNWLYEGAAALLCGATHSLASAVIVFELTGQLNLITPLLVRNIQYNMSLYGTHRSHPHPLDCSDSVLLYLVSIWYIYLRPGFDESRPPLATRCSTLVSFFTTQHNTTHNTQHTTHNTQHATHNTQHNTTQHNTPVQDIFP